MKLKNKKTGEIIDIANLDFTSDDFYIWLNTTKYNSLNELNAEWEDYVEPKEYWRITDLGELKSIRLDQHHQNIKKCKQIGNYFETKEEAEKAVEKLKAWKRLKDKGFRFIDHIDRNVGQGMTRYEWNGYIDGDDLDLLFGGEE